MPSLFLINLPQYNVHFAPFISTGLLLCARTSYPPGDAVARQRMLSCTISKKEAAVRALRGVFVLVLALALSAPVLAADSQAGLEAYNRDDYATALNEWRPLAEQGHPAAQYSLGFMYTNGLGVPQD